MFVEVSAVLHGITYWRVVTANEVCPCIPLSGKDSGTSGLIEVGDRLAAQSGEMPEAVSSGVWKLTTLTL